MFRLVEADLASAGKLDSDDRTPSLFLHRRTLYSFFRECRDLCIEIVTHEIKFVPVVRFRGMNGDLCGRQREDQPAMAGVHGGEPEGVAQEGAVGRCVGAAYDNVCAKDHRRLPFLSDAESVPRCRLCILLFSMEEETADSEHQQGEADEGVPVGDEGHGVVVVEDAEHELREMVGGEKRPWGDR
jgi:hypothetical protein